MGRQDAAQPARQRDHHDLGDQIGGLYPGDLILTGGEPAADFLQRRRHDLDVQVGNEKPKAHHAKSEDLAMSSTAVPAAAPPLRTNYRPPRLRAPSPQPRSSACLVNICAWTLVHTRDD